MDKNLTNNGDVRMDDDWQVDAQEMFKEDLDIIQEIKKLYRQRKISGYRIINGRSYIKLKGDELEILFLEDLTRFH